MLLTLYFPSRCKDVDLNSLFDDRFSDKMRNVADVYIEDKLHFPFFFTASLIFVAFAPTPVVPFTMK